MYNRYIPQEEDYIPVAEPAPPPPKAEKTGGQSAPGASLLSALGLGNLFSGAEGLVSRLLPDSVDAPIAAGDELGEMTVSYNGTVYGTVKLLALSDVSASWLLVARRDVADFFSRTVVRIVLVVLLLLILAFLFLRGNGRGRRYGKRSSGRAAPAGYRGRRR